MMFHFTRPLHRRGANSLHQTTRVLQPLSNRNYVDRQLHHNSFEHRPSIPQKSLDSFERHFSVSQPKRHRDTINEFFAKYSYFPYNRTAPFWSEWRRLRRVSMWPPRIPRDEKDKQREVREERERKSPETRIAREKHEAAWTAFRIAVVEDFGPMFGHEENDLVAWGKLCETVGISPIPESLDDRRKNIMQAHVNLVDMHECARIVKSLEIPTEENLKAYIMSSIGFYRKELAEQRLLLNAYIIRDGKIYPRIYVTEEELRVYTICSGKFYPREDAYARPLLMYLLREITGKYNGNRRIGREGKRKRG
ncbi:hypothetical protein BDD12DRAFT_933507 [Trichophaea hybrida]|nr:hypothetical protein BDD12DRAFT_933507 [Trichophaea hybrida]